MEIKRGNAWMLLLVIPGCDHYYTTTLLNSIDLYGYSSMSFQVTQMIWHKMRNEGINWLLPGFGFLFDKSNIDTESVKQFGFQRVIFSFYVSDQINSKYNW